MPTCNICGYNGNFKNIGTRLNVVCPKCNSLERHRLIWATIKEESFSFKKENRILHIAPEFCLYDKIINTDVDYYPIDIDPEHKLIRHVSDVTRLPYPDEYFDLIICSHVLDETKDGDKAISELKRVMKKNSICIISTYIRNSAVTLEKPEYSTPELRQKYYGSANRYRVYGADFVTKLATPGFRVLRYDAKLLNIEENSIGDDSLYLVKHI